MQRAHVSATSGELHFNHRDEKAKRALSSSLIIAKESKAGHIG
jgi:hypothetical protein